MKTYVLNANEMENLEALYNDGPRTKDLLPNSEYEGLVNQGLAEYMSDDKGEPIDRLVLTEEGLAYMESQTSDDSETVDEEDGEEEVMDMDEAKRSMELSVECARLDTMTVGMEGMSDILNKTITSINNAFKSFINSILNKSPLVSGFSKDDISKSLANVQYVNISNLKLDVPGGLCVKYNVYLNSLYPAINRLENIQKLMDEFTAEVGSVLTNKDKQNSTMSNDAKWKSLESEREAAYATIAACFDGQVGRTKLPYSKLVDRNKDWEEIALKSTDIYSKLTKVDRPKLLKSSKHLFELLKKVEKMSKVGGFDGVTPEVVRNISEGSYQIASELEFYAVVYYRVETLQHALEDNYKTIKKFSS